MIDTIAIALFAVGLNALLYAILTKHKEI